MGGGGGERGGSDSSQGYSFRFLVFGCWWFFFCFSKSERLPKLDKALESGDSDATAGSPLVGLPAPTPPLGAQGRN